MKMLNEKSTSKIFPEISVTLRKCPSEEDWLWTKECTLNTVGKKLKSSTTEVAFEYKEKLLLAEHSPIRELWFGFRLEIPYWVSVHLVSSNYFTSILLFVLSFNLFVYTIKIS